MNEQYAFAIAFDQQISEQNGHTEQYLANWPQLLGQISSSIASQGFPELDHPRWEEFGEGHIFWGTKQECDALKDLLSTLPISLYEERNLEPGYYTAPSGIYHVNDHGDILGITPFPDPKGETGTITSLQSIPLNAYKSQAIALEIQAKFQQAMIASANDPQGEAVAPAESLQVQNLEQQLTAHTQHISALEHQIEQLSVDLRSAQVEAASKPDPETVATLQIQYDQQTTQIQEFEQTIQQYQSQVHDLQLMLEHKVDPDVHAQLQQQAQAQADQIAELEQEINQLRDQVLSSESQRIPADEYDSLKQLSSEQSQTIAALEEKIQHLQSDLNSTQAPSETEVVSNGEPEPSHSFERIQDLEQQVAHLNQDYKTLRAKAAQKIEPRDYEAVRAEANQLTQQLHTLEQSKTQLTNEVAKWTQIANTKVELATYKDLEQLSQGQAQQLITLQQEVQGLQQEISEWKQVANEKIDPVEYEAALAQIQTLKVKLSRSWFQRLKDWLQGR